MEARPATTDGQRLQRQKTDAAIEQALTEVVNQVLAEGHSSPLAAIGERLLFAQGALSRPLREADVTATLLDNGSIDRDWFLQPAGATSQAASMDELPLPTMVEATSYLEQHDVPRRLEAAVNAAVVRRAVNPIHHIAASLVAPASLSAATSLQREAERASAARTLRFQGREGIVHLDTPDFNYGRPSNLPPCGSYVLVGEEIHWSYIQPPELCMLRRADLRTGEVTPVPGTTLADGFKRQCIPRISPDGTFALLETAGPDGDMLYRLSLPDFGISEALGPTTADESGRELLRRGLGPWELAPDGSFVLIAARKELYRLDLLSVDAPRVRGPIATLSAADVRPKSWVPP